MGAPILVGCPTLLGPGHPAVQARSEMRDSESTKTLLILGTRGIPAAHGGFETFAEQLSLYLADAGWKVYVYCQEDRASAGNSIHEESWRNVTRIIVPVAGSGSLGSIWFDWLCIWDALKRGGIPLVLGYNTGIFSPLLMFGREKLYINMDGIEWKRPKWSLPVRIWFRINEKIAMWCGDVLVADHPEIERYLQMSVRKDKTVMIPYGANNIASAPIEPLEAVGLAPEQYFITVCRIEPENSVLEIVASFSSKTRNRKLVVLGKLEPSNAYHQAVRAIASEEVMFPGPIYDQPTLASLRTHARAYCHGHTVGGTNPSLVEALGAGCAVLANDNVFNRWTAGQHQFFFSSQESCAVLFDQLIADDARVAEAREAARRQFQLYFRLKLVLSGYETVLSGNPLTQRNATDEEAHSHQTARNF